MSIVVDTRAAATHLATAMRHRGRAARALRDAATLRDAAQWSPRRPLLLEQAKRLEEDAAAADKLADRAMRRRSKFAYLGLTPA